MLGVRTRMAVIRGILTRGFEIIGFLVVLGFFVLAASYGVTKALDSKCDYFMNKLTPTAETIKVCSHK